MQDISEIYVHVPLMEMGHLVCTFGKKCEMFIAEWGSGTH